MTFPLNGWLILDKPLGISSAQAVGAVKRLLKPQKIGHGGTLDPLASGILPLALGEATKTFDYVVSHEKEYLFTVKWGEARDTDDAEGAAVAHSTQRPKDAAITALLPSFTGMIQQRPPAFSAISTDGQRAYKRARAGEVVLLPERPVEIFALEYLGSPDGGESGQFRVRCGKGTYVRSLGRDMGEQLGCLGYISTLRRTRVGKFTEKTAISLDALQKMDYTALPSVPLLAIGDVLDDILAIPLDAAQALALRHGKALVPNALTPIMAEGERGLCRDALTGQPLGIAEYAAGLIKPVRLFNL